jgi:hypothetical protein
MSNCGCTSTSSTDCYGRGSTVRQVLYPITENDCTGNSPNSATDDFQPYTTVGAANTCIVVPAVGGTVNVAVPDASLFIVGMWVTIPGFGRYPIVGVNAGTNLITLRNSCADGTTAIDGNPDPGVQVCGQIALWLTGEAPCLDAEGFLQDVKEAFESMDADDIWCVEDIAEITSGECTYLLGLSAACDAGDCPQPEDPNCLKKNPYIRFCRNTICFLEGIEPQSEDDENVALVGLSINDDGQACLRQSSGGAFFSLRAKLEEKSEIGTGAAISAEMNFSVDTAAFGVPASAKAVAIRIYYDMQNDDTINEGLFFSTHLRGNAEPITSPNTLIINNNRSINLGSADNNTLPTPAYAVVPVTQASKIIYHEWVNLGTLGTTNRFGTTLSIDGYYQ